MRHPKSNVILVIKSSILGFGLALQKFDHLCINDEHQYLAEDKKNTIAAVYNGPLRKHVRYFFVKFLCGTQGASTLEAQVESLVTRTKVLSTVVNSKATAKSITDHELWNLVGDSAVHYSIKFYIVEAQGC